MEEERTENPPPPHPAPTPAAEPGPAPCPHTLLLCCAAVHLRAPACLLLRTHIAGGQKQMCTPTPLGCTDTSLPSNEMQTHTRTRCARSNASHFSPALSSPICELGKQD